MTKVFKQGIPKQEIHIPCSCGSEHYVQFLKFDRMTFDDDTEMDELYITLGACSIRGFWIKLKIIWKILRWGEFENHGIIAERKSLEKLIDYINGVLKFWNKNYQK